MVSLQIEKQLVNMTRMVNSVKRRNPCMKGRKERRTQCWRFRGKRGNHVVIVWRRSVEGQSMAEQPIPPSFPPPPPLSNNVIQACVPVDGREQPPPLYTISPWVSRNHLDQFALLSPSSEARMLALIKQIPICMMRYHTECHQSNKMTHSNFHVRKMKVQHYFNHVSGISLNIFCFNSAPETN